MSQNTQGIALLCGAAAFGLSTSIGGMSIATGITVATFAAGVVLLVLQNSKKPVEDDSEVPKKKQGKKKSAPSPQKAPKAQQKTPKQAQHKEEPKEEPEEKEPVEAPETPSGKKKKKGKKSGGGTPLLSPSSPVVKQKAAPKEEPKEEKEYTKTQLKKLKKREAEEKQKVVAGQQKAAELAKKAAEQKREAAQQKKQQAKARKSAAKSPVPETKVETKAEVKQQQPLEVEDGWEVPTNRKSRAKDGKESKEPIVIDVKIPVRSHALIIGKQGDGLRKITEDLDVIITMPKRDSGNDLILIKGLPQDVRKAKKALEDIAKQGYSTVTHPGYQTKLFKLEDRFQLGLVFGKKGANLQAISRASGAKLQMPEKDSGNLQIAISGEERDVDQAIAIIQELIEQGYSKATHPEWITEEVPVPPEAMGAIIGTKGANLRTLMDKYHTRIDVPRREDVTAKQDVITIKGLPKDIARLKGEIAQILASREPVLDQEVPDPQWQEDVQEVEW